MNTLTASTVWDLLGLYIALRQDYSNRISDVKKIIREGTASIYEVKKDIETVKEALNSLQYRLYKRDGMNVCTFGCNTEWGDLLGKKFANILNLDEGVLSYNDYVVVCDEDTTLKSVEFVAKEREELRQLFC